MSVILKPLITEKSTDQSEVQNTFTFLVDVKANKVQIKNEIESTYNVSVDKVRTLRVLPKYKTRYTKTGIVSGKTNAYKKAMIKVAEGDTLDLYNNL
ncbi:LSU ribosomal protein L23P [Psychroflexus salarius]|jgi:large subunit ribosomal protein L23|uniref:Large ribosomal subunit protein uL23 n=1 Tax=Psychroflexus salarius TaxID=1155689 RepID=A0A1M4UA90_9FLAO|nr:50S ribosomal protein L23 [Psychroflexus salarius]SHE53483.1 LSU ribosomal protein L23P [Psychroflexus salarius]